jgi:hypothetical protein
MIVIGGFAPGSPRLLVGEWWGLSSGQLLLVTLRSCSCLHTAVFSAWCLAALLHSDCLVLLPDPHGLVQCGGVAGQLAMGLEVVDTCCAPSTLEAGEYTKGFAGNSLAYYSSMLNFCPSVR